jgi:hypothetical protein
MRHLVICGLPTLQYFSTLSQNRHDFRKKYYRTQSLFRFSQQFLSEMFLILRRNERGKIKKMYNDLYLKRPLFLSDFKDI